MKSSRAEQHTIMIGSDRKFIVCGNPRPCWTACQWLWHPGDPPPANRWIVTVTASAALPGTVKLDCPSPAGPSHAAAGRHGHKRHPGQVRITRDILVGNVDWDSP